MAVKYPWIWARSAAVTAVNWLWSNSWDQKREARITLCSLCHPQCLCGWNSHWMPSLYVLYAIQRLCVCFLSFLLFLVFFSLRLFCGWLWAIPGPLSLTLFFLLADCASFQMCWIWSFVLLEIQPPRVPLSLPPPRLHVILLPLFLCVCLTPFSSAYVCVLCAWAVTLLWVSSVLVSMVLGRLSGSSPICWNIQ